MKAWMVVSSLLVCGFALAPRASATLVTEDWKTAGDGLLTLDTDTGLEWLNLTVTQDESYDDVTTQLGAGGEYDGFEHATVDQVNTLGEDAGITELSGQYDGNNIATIQNLINHVGITFNEPGYDQESDGFVVDTYNGEHRYPFFEVYGGGAEASVYSAGYGPDPSANFGNWMVSTVAVPEPGTLCLVSLGVIGILGRRRRGSRV